MNHELRQRIKELENQLVETRRKVIGLELYVTSPKFRSGDSLDNYVCCDDVLRYCVEIRNETIL